MILLDTGYLVAQVRRRDSLYLRAKSWSEAVKEPLVVTEYVLWETVNALSIAVERPKAHAIVRHLNAAADCEVVPASSELWQTGLKVHAERVDKDWSLTDCISFNVMTARGITQALAYDHHFEQAGFEALLRREPN